MKNKKIKIAVGIIIFSINSNAQESINAGGGSNENVSYSVGQCFYTDLIGISGIINHGVQQAYEIYAVARYDNLNIILNAVIFPNPTTNLIYLKISNEVIEDMEYQLFDFTGKLLLQEKITDNNTYIQMTNYSKNIYFLNVNKHSKTLKIFKILKN